MTDHVHIQEVGLRDGLQSIATTMPTEAKKRWISAAYDAGLRHIEVTSFVPPKLLPQLADAAQIVDYSLQFDGLTVTALVPNLKGAENALKAGVHRIVAPISVSTQHSLANVRRKPMEMVQEFGRIRELIDAHGGRTTLIAGLSTVFGCTLQGEVPVDDVCDVVIGSIAAGADTVALADTTGHATPAQVQQVITAVRAVAGERLRSMHFHDTRGMGLANTVIALQNGIREFDASLAGIGGCPHAPGATGNVVTEDLVFMLESMGYHTGISVEILLACRQILSQALPQEPLYGFINRAGLPNTFTQQRATQ